MVEFILFIIKKKWLSLFIHLPTDTIFTDTIFTDNLLPTKALGSKKMKFCTEVPFITYRNHKEHFFFGYFILDTWAKQLLARRAIVVASSHCPRRNKNRFLIWWALGQICFS